MDSFLFFPNFMLLVWRRTGTSRTTTGRLRTARTSSRARSTSSPRRTARERLRQELAAVTFKEYALQDGNTLEATQTMLESRAVPSSRSTTRRSCCATCTRRPVAMVERVPDDPRAGPDLGRTERGRCRMPTLPAEFADLEPFADWSLATEAERYAKRLSSTMDELQAFYDAAFPRLEEAAAYLDTIRPRRAARGRHPPAVALLLAGQRLVPRRGVAPAAGPRQRCRQPGQGRRTGRLTSEGGAPTTRSGAVTCRKNEFLFSSVAYRLVGDPRFSLPPVRLSDSDGRMSWRLPPPRTTGLAGGSGRRPVPTRPACGPRTGCRASSTPPSSS